MSRSAPRTRTAGNFQTFSIRIPDGAKMRAEIAALRQGKSLSAMVAEVLTEAFSAVSPLDELIARISVQEYDQDALPVSRLAVLQTLSEDALALVAAIETEMAKAKADNENFVGSLKRASEEIEASRDSLPIHDPWDNE